MYHLSQTAENVFNRKLCEHEVWLESPAPARNVGASVHACAPEHGGQTAGPWDLVATQPRQNSKCQIQRETCLTA